MALILGTVCPPNTQSPDIRGDQAIVGVGHQRMLFVSFPQILAGRRFLAGMATQVTDATPDDEHPSSVHIAVSFLALVALGAEGASTFPLELRQGLRFHETTAPGMPSGLPVHAMVIVAADSAELLDERIAATRSVISAAGVVQLTDPHRGGVEQLPIARWTGAGPYVVYRQFRRDTGRLSDPASEPYDEDGSAASEDPCARRHGILRRGITYGLLDDGCPHHSPMPLAPDLGLLLLCYQPAGSRGVDFVEQHPAIRLPVGPADGVPGAGKPPAGEYFFAPTLRAM